MSVADRLIKAFEMSNLEMMYYNPDEYVLSAADNFELEQRGYIIRLNKFIGRYYITKSLYVEPISDNGNNGFVVKSETTVTSCRNCPYKYTSMTYGNDGRDGHTVNLCSKGVFGRMETGNFEGYAEGLRFEDLPNVIPYNCPFNNKIHPNTVEIANCIKVSPELLQQALKKYNWAIVPVKDGQF